jgi:Activator of Hsp90 ATPase homolog 1-like protein
VRSANATDALTSCVLPLPPNLVEFEWTGGPTQPAGSRVRFELTAEGESTRLILTHSRTSAPAAPDFAAGWHYHLDTLSFLIEGAEPPADRPTWQQLRGHYLPTAQLPGTRSPAQPAETTFR